MWLQALAVWVVLASPLAADRAHAASNDPIGTWLTDEGKAKVDISACGRSGQLCSKIIWLKDPNDSVGKPLRDMRNKSDTQRGRPIIGMPILTNLEQAGPANWSGNIYNPEDGNTYKASMTMLSKDRIQLKGCAMFGLVCGEKNWTRLAAEPKLEAKAKPPKALPAAVKAPAPPPPPPPVVAASGEVVDEEAIQIQEAQEAEKRAAEQKHAARADRPARVQKAAPTASPAPIPAVGTAPTAPVDHAATVSEAPVQAVIAKPVPAHAVAAAAPVPHGPVAREDMMFLAAPPRPEEAVSGVQMQLETPDLTTVPVEEIDDSGAADEGDADVREPPLRDHSTSAEPGLIPALPEMTAAAEPAAGALETPPTAAAPAVTAPPAVSTEPAPPLPVRAADARDAKASADADDAKPAPKRKANKAARVAKPSKSAKRVAPATKTVATTKATRPKTTAETAVAGSSTTRTPEKLPWLEDGETAPPPRVVGRPGSIRALLNGPKG